MAKQIGCEIEFKINHRNWGKITEDNKVIAWSLLEEHYDQLH